MTLLLIALDQVRVKRDAVSRERRHLAGAAPSGLRSLRLPPPSLGRLAPDLWDTDTRGRGHAVEGPQSLGCGVCVSLAEGEGGRLRRAAGCSCTVFTTGVGGIRERWGGAIPQRVRRRVSGCPLGAVSRVRPDLWAGMIPGRRSAHVFRSAQVQLHPQPGDRVAR